MYRQLLFGLHVQIMFRSQNVRYVRRNPTLVRRARWNLITNWASKCGATEAHRAQQFTPKAMSLHASSKCHVSATDTRPLPLALCNNQLDCMFSSTKEQRHLVRTKNLITLLCAVLGLTSTCCLHIPLVCGTQSALMRPPVNRADQ